MPFAVMSQTGKTTVQVYGGYGILGSMTTEQTGAAHKRGDFNAFQTDFDLDVRVTGKTGSANFLTTGLSMGHVWTKEGRKVSPLFDLDINHTTGKFSSDLANPAAEQVINVNGPKGDSVRMFVAEHYSTGHHTFTNTADMATWNATANIGAAYALNEKLSLSLSLGLGFTSMTLKNASSIQTAPASPAKGYESTKDLDGDAVNHLNSQTVATSTALLTQVRLGANYKLTEKLAITFDARTAMKGAGTFNFGSTVYSDHPPTNNWLFKTGNSTNILLNLGLAITL